MNAAAVHRAISCRRVAVGIDAEVVAGNHVVAGVQQDAVLLEVDDSQAAHGAISDKKDKPAGSSCIGAIKLDDRRAGIARLACAINKYRVVLNRRKAAPRADRLWIRAGEYSEVDDV